MAKCLYHLFDMIATPQQSDKEADQLLKAINKVVCKTLRDPCTNHFSSEESCCLVRLGEVKQRLPLQMGPAA